MSWHDEFFNGLKELGYDHSNLTLHVRWAEGVSARLPTLGAEVIAEAPDLIVAADVPSALVLKEATQSIPIVVAVSGDMVGLGLVETLGRPGRNITGLTTLADTLSAKRFELLSQVVPGLSHVAVIWNSSSGPRTNEWAQTEAAARALGIRISVLDLTSDDQLEGLFKAATCQSQEAQILDFECDAAQALLVWGDPITIRLRKEIADFQIQYRLPGMHERGEIVNAGGLISYGVSLAHMYRKAAGMADRVLKGSPPQTTPVEQPTEFEMIVNLSAARALGITVPESIVRQANQVIP